MTYAQDIAKSTKRVVTVVEATFFNPPSADYNIAAALAAAAANDEDYFFEVLPQATINHGPLPDAPEPPSTRGWTATSYPAFSGGDAGDPAGDVLVEPGYPLAQPWSDPEDVAFVDSAPDASLAIELRYTTGATIPFSVDAYIPLLGVTGRRHIGVSMDVWTEAGFDWGTGGGKVAGGLWGGGDESVGNVPPWNQDGVTVRNVWGVGGAGVQAYLYSYHLNRGMASGALSVGLPNRWSTGEWQTLEYEGRINNPGRANGFCRYWLDGECLGEITDAIWALNDDWMWRGIMISDAWQTGTISQSQMRWIKNLKAYS